MTIKEKINKFISEKKITHAEIGRGLNTSQQNVSRILGESGKIPLDFVVWLATEYQEIDLNKLLLEENQVSIVNDNVSSYDKTGRRKEKALEEISAIMDKYF